ncbi:MAG TPA: SCO family protein [Thiobacillaceae bacterium]|nr:SCO family protein [Thiobacillaceae bacterium]
MSRSIAAGLLVLAVGVGLLWFGTDGFSAFTSEAARRHAVSEQPRVLPDAVLEDQDGRLFRLRDHAGKLVAVEFVYTRCRTVCSALGAGFRQIGDSLPPAALGRDFVRISVSFDPANDTPAALKAYAQRFGADGTGWRVARVNSETDLKRLLDAFGITVIADGMGGFEHNAAIHLLDRSGRLALIADHDRPLAFAAQVRTRL